MPFSADAFSERVWFIGKPTGSHGSCLIFPPQGPVMQALVESPLGDSNKHPQHMVLRADEENHPSFGILITLCIDTIKQAIVVSRVSRLPYKNCKTRRLLCFI